MKKYILTIIVTAVIFTGIGALAATSITADQIAYDENTTVKDKIDDLYTLSNRSISFGTKKYSQVLGDIPTESRTSLTLDKGKYFVVANLNLGLVNPTSNITDANAYSDGNFLTFSCSSCTYNQLTSRYYHPVASTANTSYTASGKKMHIQTYLVTYYIEVTGNQSTIAVSNTRSWNTTLPTVIALHAIPIN